MSPELFAQLKYPIQHPSPIWAKLSRLKISNNAELMSLVLVQVWRKNYAHLNEILFTMPQLLCKTLMKYLPHFLNNSPILGMNYP